MAQDETELELDPADCALCERPGTCVDCPIEPEDLLSVLTGDLHADL